MIEPIWSTHTHTLLYFRELPKIEPTIPSTFDRVLKVADIGQLFNTIISTLAVGVGVGSGINSFLARILAGLSGRDWTLVRGGDK